MASRSKKDALDALDKLGDYLSRDRTATILLQSVSKYVAEIRREKSSQSDKLLRSQSEVSAMTAVAARDSAKIAELTNELSAESSRRRQAESASAIDRGRLQAMAEKLSPPKGSELNVDERRFRSLIDSVTKQMPLSPHGIVSRLKGGRCGIYEISDFIHDMVDDEFTILGKFVLLFVLINGDPVAFEFDKVMGRRFRDMGKKFTDSRNEKLIRWIKEWIEQEPEYKNRLYDAQIAAGAVVSGRYVEAPPNMPDNPYTRRSRDGK